MFKIRRLYFSNRLTIHKVINKSSAQLCHQGLVQQQQHFWTFVFHTAVQRRF